jgi:lipoprotein-releasing system ATP-binding protein
MPSAGIAIQLRGVSKTYHLNGRVIPVLRDVSLDIASGECVAVVGASGSGKSTMLHLLGLLDRPTKGTILYDGKELLADRDVVIEQFRNQNVGFVFQFHHLLPEFSALENVMMPALIAGWTMGDAREAARVLLERVGLAERVDHAPGELSGGEQQRTALARALVLQPSLVLADEPTGNLDPTTGGAIHELLLELNRDLGTTFLIATHNLELAGTMPRRLALEAGDLHPV